MCRFHQGADIFGKATAAIARTWVDEVVANALVTANALPHGFNVCADTLSQVGHFIHEADLGGQHAIGRVFGQLGASHTHHNDLVVVAVERFIQLSQNFFSTCAAGANDDAVGFLAIGNRCAFFQKLWVRHHIERDVHAPGLECGLHGLGDFVGSAHGHRGFVHNDGVARHVGGDGFGDRQHMFEVCAAVFIGRRANRDELQLRLSHCLSRIGCEAQSAFCEVAFDDGFQAWLKNRDLALA